MMNGLKGLMNDLELETKEELLQWKEENPEDPISIQLEEVFQSLIEGGTNEK